MPARLRAAEPMNHPHAVRSPSPGRAACSTDVIKFWTKMRSGQEVTKTARASIRLDCASSSSWTLAICLAANGLGLAGPAEEEATSDVMDLSGDSPT